MKASRVLFLLSAVTVGVPLMASAAPAPAAADAKAKAPKLSKQAQRGQYLVTFGGCNDCHTPMAMGPQGPAPDMAHMLSGHPEAMKMPPAPQAVGPWVIAMAGTNTAFEGPWGRTYVPNITSDKETGIGNWTEKQFIQAMRTGKHQGAGRPILPPMGWQNLAALTDDDLKSVYAYLESTPPVKNKVPDPMPPAAAAGGPGAGGPPPPGGDMAPPPAPAPAPKK